MTQTHQDGTNQTLINRIQEHAYRIEDLTGDFTPLLNKVGDAQMVLLGEASHGTQEFYQARAEITKRLISEKGFKTVAVEADWPDAYRVNRYIQGRSEDASSQEALNDFTRFPTWMWRNHDLVDFIDWLRDYNQGLPQGSTKAGFYGLDLYSLNSSMQAVIQYLEKVDPEAAQRARYRYACFDHYGEDPQAYGYAASFDLGEKCETEVIGQLVDLHQKAYEYLRRDGFVAEDEFFYVEQNALIAKNAERYYRSMFEGPVVSWNLRDRHMVQTLADLKDHFESQGRPAKFVVWEHNSHIGDARATEMSQRGELNVGQLVRQHWGGKVVLVGMTTYTGTVSAASDWDAPLEQKNVREALPGSFEWLFHFTEIPRFLLLLDEGQEALSDLRQERLERAIGVVYRPETERMSHYFYAQLMNQFNAVLYFDRTHAVEPLDRVSEWEQGELPETFPSGV